MRPPTGIFFAMLLGVVALLFGFGIAVVITGALPERIKYAVHLETLYSVTMTSRIGSSRFAAAWARARDNIVGVARFIKANMLAGRLCRIFAVR